MHGSFENRSGGSNEDCQPNEHDLGAAGKMARAFIDSPLSPLLFVACLFMGILGLMFTPRQEDPQISVPMVDIFVSYAGASAQQVASLAIDPLERMMSEMPGVKHVYSASQRGQGMVTVQFQVGEQMEPSLIKLYDKLQSNMDQMPPGVGKPLVKPKGADDVPVVTLTLWSNSIDDASLRLVALEVRQRLKEVPDTANSFIVGGRTEQMRIEVYPERLAGFGISMGQIAEAVQSANVNKGIGFGESGGSSFSVYSGNFLKSVGDLENLIIGVRKGTPVYLRDVAKLTQGPGEAANVVEYYTGPSAAQAGLVETGGSPAVTIAIAKKAGSNGVTVAQNILARVEELKGSVIPDNLQVAVTRDYGASAGEKVDGLIIKLFVATGAVVVLIFMALGFIWQPALVVALVIPVVILITVFSAYILGYTIDRVSLFALIFSIGILVDDAIVVVENIYRRWLMNGEVDTDTTIDAVAEVGNPTILATFTVIAALLPMGFVSGMMGPYMAPIPALGSVAMLFSLFAAFLFTPWLVMRIRPNMDKLRVMEAREHKQTVWFGRIFGQLLSPLLDSPRKARIFRLAMWATFFLACAMFYTQHVTVKMLPLDNKPEFNVIVNMPDGSSLPSTANTLMSLTQKVLSVKEVTAVQTYSGTASPFNFNGLVRHTYLRQKPWQGDIQIQLLHKNKRARTSHEIAVEVRALLTPMANELKASIQVVEMPPGPPVLQTMVAEIYGPDADTRRQVARDMTSLFKKTDTIVDVDNYLDKPYENWTFEVDRPRARQYGISARDITEQLSMAMGGFRLGDLKVGHELEAKFIVLQAPLSVRTNMNQLLQLPIASKTGKLVPLNALGSFKRQATDRTIFHKDLRAVEYVTGEVAGRLAAPVYGMIEVSNLLDDYKTPDGVSLSGELWGGAPDNTNSSFAWGGEWTVTFETFRDMGAAFMVAMVLIYMLVVWEFGNFRTPAIIMAPIPLTLIGIIPGHWLLGAEFTATSMIGWIALAGIIVRNSILLVDFTEKSMEQGMERRDAVMAAVVARARPILITAFALVAGSSVIITDPIFNGMAISLMFGVVVATGLTLFVIPLACVRNSKLVVEPEPLKQDEQELVEQRPAFWSGLKMPARLPVPEFVTSLPLISLRRQLQISTLKGMRFWRMHISTGSLLEEAIRGLLKGATNLFYLLVVAGSDIISRVQTANEHKAQVATENLPTVEIDVEEDQQPLVSTVDVVRDDLKKIKGIGPMIERLLNQNGIFTFAQVVSLNDREICSIEQTLSKSNQGAIGRIRRDGWVAQASRFTNDESFGDSLARAANKAALKRVVKKPTDSYPPVAHSANDNLQEIKGIGRVIEKILIEQGITRFEQLANLTPREIDLVGIELDKKPRLGRARIARDNWVSQAQAIISDQLEVA
ncbi:MAG: AcrB/AcrD/AcrF family protein [bacterium]|nr:AcrB/AcrD/AcrF family protein [bacterium]